MVVRSVVDRLVVRRAGFRGVQCHVDGGPHSFVAGARSLLLVWPDVRGPATAARHRHAWLVLAPGLREDHWHPRTTEVATVLNSKEEAGHGAAGLVAESSGNAEDDFGANERAML